MPNPMDNAPFVNGHNLQLNVQPNLMQIIQQAQQNPNAFEEQMRRTNPQAYEMACQIRNSANPREAILQLAQRRGVNPNILKQFGLM